MRPLPLQIQTWKPRPGPPYWERMKRPPIETVLFDLDGTLVDNFEAIHRCYDDVMRLMGLPGVSLGDVKRAVGGSVNVTVVKLAGEANAPTATRLFREHFPSVIRQT